MPKKGNLLYLSIADGIEHQIRSGVLKTGDRLPALRTLCSEKGVSLGTATLAYLELESRSLIASRPRSGYFVSWSPAQVKDLPSATRPLATSRTADTKRIIDTILQNSAKASVHLSSGVPAVELLPAAKLNKAMVQALRELPDSGIGYERHGNEKLKIQIARRSLLWDGVLKPNDLITTAGCMDALAFCMQSVAQRGDTIAVESPLYFGIMHMAQNIGLQVMELPMHPTMGVEMEALEKAMKTKKIKACLLVSNFNNPLGSSMPDEHKRATARMAEKYNVPVIEDDLYGDLYYGTHRPLTCKTFDEAGMVLYCSSFSKTLAAGYRVGWVAPGKFFEAVNRTKNYHSICCNVLAHAAVAIFLENERYEQHLKKLRQSIYRNTLQVQRCISDYFPANTRVSRPQGGFHLWVELGKNADTIELYNRAIHHKISFSPGRMYTLRNQYNNCLRLGTGLFWNEKSEASFKLLGTLAEKISK